MLLRFCISYLVIYMLLVIKSFSSVSCFFIHIKLWIKTLFFSFFSFTWFGVGMKAGLGSVSVVVIHCIS